MTDPTTPDLPVGELVDECECELPSRDRFDSGLITGVIACIIIVAAAFAFFAHVSPEKHTGKVRVMSGNSAEGYMMERPNHEMFYMRFDNALIEFAGVFEDITYTDISRDRLHFIKARIYVAKPEPPLMLIRAICTINVCVDDVVR